MEADRVADRDLGDVGFIDLSGDVDGGKILGEREQLGRRRARGYRLADLDGAIDDDAVDRSADEGVIEVDLGAVELGLPLLQVGLRVLNRRLGARVIGLGELVSVVGGLQRGRGRRPLAASVLLVARSLSALAWLIEAFCRPALAVATLACAIAIEAWSCRIFVSNGSGSMRARRSPFLTTLL